MGQLLSQTEFICTSLRVHDKKVNGCQRYKKDIMVSFTCEQKEEVFDLFLTNQQAQYLIEELTNKIKRNENED